MRREAAEVETSDEEFDTGDLGNPFSQGVAAGLASLQPEQRALKLLDGDASGRARNPAIVEGLRQAGFLDEDALKPLIARIEDPTYLLVAVKRSSGITDLAQIGARKAAVKINPGQEP